jgi:hypothetical protein
MGEALGGHFDIEPRRRSPFGAGPLSVGATTDRTPDPTVMRGLREIDPRLGLEWRPMGLWWTTWMAERPPGAAPGCWRLTLKGKSGRRKGMMLCPPWWGTSAQAGELVAYMKVYWAPRLKDIRDFYANTEAFSDELTEKASRDRRMAALDKIDHGILRHHSRGNHADRTGAGFSGREYFSAGMGGDSRLW